MKKRHQKKANQTLLQLTQLVAVPLLILAVVAPFIASGQSPKNATRCISSSKFKCPKGKVWIQDRCIKSPHGSRWETSNVREYPECPTTELTWETKSKNPARTLPMLMEEDAATGDSAGAVAFGTAKVMSRSRAPAIAAESAAKPAVGTAPVLSKKKLSKRLPSKLPQPKSGLLTAGSFDDAINTKIFRDYWKKTPLAKGQHNSFDVSEIVNNKKSFTLRKHNRLQLAFVFDVTGSMGDELEYLKKEFHSIVAHIDKKHPDTQKEYALIVYRDETDQFITRGIRFTDKLAEFQEFLNEQSANGGGDYPEAVHTALQEAVDKLGWESDQKVAKMIFHVADAPPHHNKIEESFEAIRELQAKDVAIYPVAASGVADLAEAVMRGAAYLTGGQYIFLTDDSGIGNPHAKPKFPCYHVEKLKDVMIRMVGDRITGKRSEPSKQTIVRTVGKPKAGMCKR